MKIAFYKDKSHLFNRLVSWWDGSPYSHCEVVLEEPGADGLWLCGSSSFRDGGVRVKWIDLASGNWDVVEFPSTTEQDARAYQWFKDHEGDRYDVLFLVGFLIRLVHGKARAWGCSEAVLDAALGLFESWRFTPAAGYSITRSLSLRQPGAV